MASAYRGAPTLSAEILAWRRGRRRVAGLDEAGRGPMAGPVVAGAVVFDPEVAQPWWSELRDCKLLTPKQREALDERIRATATWGVGLGSSVEIDTMGLVEATRLAMLRALEQLPFQPDHLLIDALLLHEQGAGWTQESIVHGDALSASIAAASIIAKVERDRLMDGYHIEYPDYGFDENRGYCTPPHKRALEAHGPTPIHRRSFAPVRSHIEGHQLPFEDLPPEQAGAK
jgi:ribonuclease HII